MTTQLHGSHLKTCDALSRHPIARNLAWREVRSMLGALDAIEQEEHDGTLTVTVHGRTLVLHTPVRENLADVQELMDLRRFLQQSEAPQAAVAG